MNKIHILTLMYIYFYALESYISLARPIITALKFYILMYGQQ